jgi:hypothetical protein
MAFLLLGVVGIMLARTPREGGAFVVVAGVAAGLAVIAHLSWALRGLRRAQRLPGTVVIGTRWRAFWQRALPGFGPIAVVVGSNFVLGNGSSWVIGAICLAFGAALMLEAAYAVHIERLRGTRVLRLEQRFVLAH